MIIQETIGNLDTLGDPPGTIDWLPLEWYETEKRIQRKRTKSGKEVMLKFLRENPGLRQGDILSIVGSAIIAVDIIPAECIVIQPRNLHEMAALCYEIGNKHLPLFYDHGKLIVPFEGPIFRHLIALEYDAVRDVMKLVGALKTTTAPHKHSNRTGLFETIMQLTQSNS